MLTAALNALSQMLTPPFRTVLLKSIGLAALLLILFAIGLHRLIAFAGSSGEAWLQTSVGSVPQGALTALLWVLAVLAGFGLAFAVVFLMPAVTAVVAGFFGDEIAEQVERSYYPADPPGKALSVPRAAIEGVTFGLLALVVYVCAVPFLLVAGLGVVIFFFANSYLLGRQYFELAAMRHHPVAEAKALRKAASSTVFVAGMFIAAFVSIPIVNLATPLFGTAFMVHMYKRIAGERRELLEPR